MLTVVAGVSALIALDSGRKAGDICACLLLAVALASASPLVVAVGLIVEVVWRRPRRDKSQRLLKTLWVTNSQRLLRQRLLRQRLLTLR